MTRPAIAAESSTPDEVVARIRELFALAGSPNEYEAALALEKAHALLLRYNLGAEAVTSGSDSRTDAVTDVRLPGFGCYLWRLTLLSVLATTCSVTCCVLGTKWCSSVVRPTSPQPVRCSRGWCPNWSGCVW